MNNEALKDAIDEMHVAVLCDKEDIESKWWKLLHRLLILQELNDEIHKRGGIGNNPCVMDNTRECEVHLYCQYWDNKFNKILAKRNHNGK